MGHSNRIGKANPTALKLLLCLMAIVFYACGGGGGGGSGGGASETGSVSFGLALQDFDISRASFSRAANDGDIGFACQSDAYDIEMIEAQVVDENGNPLTLLKSFPCDDHQGTIGDVPVGNDRFVKVFARDPDGVLLFEGKSKALTIAAGETTNAGLITLEPVIFLESMTRVSVDSDGNEVTPDSILSAVNSNGRFVAFVSLSDDLSTDDTNGFADVYLRDLITGSTELISVASDGELGDDDSGFIGLGQDRQQYMGISISANGRFVAFVSAASNLVESDTNGSVPDIFVRDRANNSTELVSLNPNGIQANSSSENPSINDNGQFVAFQSNATNLISDDTNDDTNGSISDVFVRDRVGETTELISRNSNQTQANLTSGNPSISGDGQFVAFESNATNLIIGDTSDENGSEADIFVRDRVSGETDLISVDSDRIQGNNDSNNPSISRSGYYVAFESTASNLVEEDTNGSTSDIFVHDRVGLTTDLVSINSEQIQANEASNNPSISGDGEYVAFESSATNLAEVTIGQNIFIRDLIVNQTELISDSQVGDDGSLGSALPEISSNGRVVTFTSDAPDLVEDDNNDVFDVFAAPNPFTEP
jgi:hypothetical protein